MYHVAMQQLLPHVIRTCSNWKGSRKKGLGLRYVKLYKDCNTWCHTICDICDYLWLFFSVCGCAPPCYSCKDFITFRRTCIHSRGYDTLYWQEKTYCAVPKWVVLASSETRLGANRIVADCFQTYPWSSEFLERVHVIHCNTVQISTVAIGRTMTQRKNHFWSCSGNGIYHAAEHLDIVALSGQWPLSPVCARLVHALETYLLSFCARKGCVSQWFSVCLMLSGAFHRFGIPSCPFAVLVARTGSRLGAASDSCRS